MVRRVVVTGLGMVSPLGIGIEESWRSACSGVSGIDTVTKFDASEFPSRIAGEVKGFNALDFMDKQNMRRLDTFIH